MKTTLFNINTPIVFTATEKAKHVLSTFFLGYEELWKVDKSGVCSMQLWEVMKVFANNVTEDGSILFEQIEINMNQLIYVKLTERGEKVLKQKDFGLFTPNEEGYYVMEMWQIIRIFGNEMHMGVDILFEKNVIEIPVLS